MLPARLAKCERGKEIFQSQPAVIDIFYTCYPFFHRLIEALLSIAEERELQRMKISEKQMAAQVFVFFIAGFETTSSTTAFTLYELAKKPDVQDKVIEELTEVLKKHNGKVTYETIMDLPYMEMAVQGELFHPSIPIIALFHWIN